MGRADGALDDLAIAVERDPDLAGSASKDDDFLSLWEIPSFVRLVTRDS